MGLAGALAIHFKPLSPPKVKKEKGSSLLLAQAVNEFISWPFARQVLLRLVNTLPFKPESYSPNLNSLNTPFAQRET